MTRTKIPKKASGIYQIQSKLNNKIYVGSAVNLRGRKYIHFRDLKLDLHCNKYLQRHVDKYGEEDLQFSILEFCQKENLIEREQYYIDSLQPEFNICQVAGSSFGTRRTEETKQKMRGKNNPMYGISRIGENATMWGKKHSKETKQKMSNAHKGQIAWNKGKTCSKETKQKMSEAQSGEKNSFYGKKHSEETRQKISLACMGRVSSRKGAVLTEETKQKISQAKKGKKIKGRKGVIFTEEHKRNISIANTGENNGMHRKQHHSEETKQKMRDAWKRRKMKLEVENG